MIDKKSASNSTTSSTLDRRTLLKSLVAGSTAVIGSKVVIPEKWGKPVINSILLPAHAQGTLPTPESDLDSGDTDSGDTDTGDTDTGDTDTGDTDTGDTDTGDTDTDEEDEEDGFIDLDEILDLDIDSDFDTGDTDTGQVTLA